MSPRTPLIPLVGVLAALGACGAPPQPLPKSPPYAAPSAGPSSVGPSMPLGVPLPTLTGYPTNPVYPTFPTATGTVRPTATTTTTTPATTKSPTPTPSHAARCTGEPTGAQILDLIRELDGIPDATLRVFQGPFCSGTWSFTTVEVDGGTTDQVEPLMVVATGKGSTLRPVAAGSDVCVARVQATAPSGIRVLACGF